MKVIDYTHLINEIDALISQFKRKEQYHKIEGCSLAEMMAHGSHASLERLKDALIFVPKITIDDESNEEIA